MLNWSKATINRNRRNYNRWKRKRSTRLINMSNKFHKRILTCLRLRRTQSVVCPSSLGEMLQKTRSFAINTSRAEAEVEAMVVKVLRNPSHIMPKNGRIVWDLARELGLFPCNLKIPGARTQGRPRSQRRPKSFWRMRLIRRNNTWQCNIKRKSWTRVIDSQSFDRRRQSCPQDLEIRNSPQETPQDKRAKSIRKDRKALTWCLWLSCPMMDVARQTQLPTTNSTSRLSNWLNEAIYYSSTFKYLHGYAYSSISM